MKRFSTILWFAHCVIACLCLSRVVVEGELCTSTFLCLVKLATLNWAITPKPWCTKLGHSNNCSHKYRTEIWGSIKHHVIRGNHLEGLRASWLQHSVILFFISMFLSVSLFIPTSLFLSPSFDLSHYPTAQALTYITASTAAESELHLKAWLERSTSCLKWGIVQEREE